MKTRRLPGILKLPDPKYVRPKKRASEKCVDCKAPLMLRRGYGYCESCQLTVPLPVAYVLSYGSQEGKPIYLRDAIMREIREDNEDGNDQLLQLDKELTDRSIIIIEETDAP
jgi:hypothetical protein